MAFKGTYTDDYTDEEIPSGELVELTIRTETNGEVKVVHLSSETWDDLLESSDLMSSVFFSEDND